MRLKNEPDYSLWIIYFLISLFILGIDSLGWLSGIRSLGEKIINPVSRITRITSEALSRPIQIIRFAASGPEKILDLESRYAEAIVSLEEMDSLKKENSSLKKLLGNNPDETVIYQPAYVVGGSTEIIISSGSVSSIQPGDTVVDASKSLVGRVSRVSEYTSWVVTPSHHTVKIPIIIGTSRVSGFLKIENGKLTIEVEQSDNVSLGSYVSTSGVNGEYVPNITIGKVSFMEAESANIYKKVVIDLLSSSSDIVFIIKGKS